MRGFYAGISAPLAGVALSNAACFMFYGRAIATCEHFGWFRSDKHAPHTDSSNSKETCSEKNCQETARSPLGAVFFSGALAGLATATVLTPIELIKSQMQREQQLSVVAKRPPRFNTAPGCLRYLLRSSANTAQQNTFGTFLHAGGILFSAYSATLCREIPGLACWFGLYEYTLRSVFTPQTAEGAGGDMPWYAYPIAGSVAGLGYWSVLYPADTVKTRMQLDPAYQRLGLWKSLRRVYLLDNGGLRALYRGYGVTAVHAVMANATIFTTYETVKKHLFVNTK